MVAARTKDGARALQRPYVECLALAARLTTRLSNGAISEALKGAGLRVSPTCALMLVDINNGCATPKHLAVVSGKSQPSISNRLRRLEAAGLVQSKKCRPGEGDGRVHKLELSQEGRAICAVVDALFSHHCDALDGLHVETKQIDVANQVLRRADQCVSSRKR